MSSEQQQEQPSPKEEWEIRRDDLKSQGDTHFRTASYPSAILAYESALALDPTNHVILSNKSAAHLANGEKSKALVDARKCVENAPKWTKGYTRLAAAMASLGRFGEAAGVYQKVLNELEPGNGVAKKGLEECRKKEQLKTEEMQKEKERVQMELDRQKAEKERQKVELQKGQQQTQVKATKEDTDGAGINDEEDDLLDDFFSEVEKATEKPKPTSKPINNNSEQPTPDSNTNNSKSDAENKDDKSTGDDSSSNNNNNNRIKIELNNLGTSTFQINRLLQTNYEWKNLNPFYVLDIPHTIEDESVISARYRALSLLVHPDKCPEDPARAKSAFEQVRKAMASMNDEDKRRHVRALVEQGMKQGKRDWEEERAKLNHDNGNNINYKNLSEAEKESLQQSQQKATMKIFAEIEQKRREVERRKRKFEQRERAQEDEEKEKEKNERDYDKRWREVERVEKRVGNWRDFQGGSGGGGGKKKSRWG